jgi:hypothetical protein
MGVNHPEFVDNHSGAIQDYPGVKEADPRVAEDQPVESGKLNLAVATHYNIAKVEVEVLC